MAKRRTGKFKRRKNDKYITPYSPMKPLLPHLQRGTKFVEPCAANARMAGHLVQHGHVCTAMYDIKPDHEQVQRKDALTLQNVNLRGADFIITNPPWTRELLHPMIEHLRMLAPTWLLFDADWKYTKQINMAKRNGCKSVVELMPYCHKIVSVGRVSWMENGTSGKDNCAWYLFDKLPGKQRFYARCE